MPVVTVKTHKLGRAMMAKRGSAGLRQIEKQVGVHHTTLMRVELGAEPTMDTFRRIMEWLGAPKAQWAEYMDFKF